MFFKQCTRLVIWVTLLRSWSQAYNINDEYADVIESPQKSAKFGYSVTAQKLNGTVVIWAGAPKLHLNSQDDNSTTQSVHGGIYRCTQNKTSEKFTCQLVSIDQKQLDPHKQVNHTKDIMEQIREQFPQTAVENCEFYPNICDSVTAIKTDNFTWLNCNATNCHNRNPTGSFKPSLPSGRNYKISARKTCFSSASPGERLSGPPDFTIHDDLLIVNPESLPDGASNGVAILETMFAPTFPRLNHCLRFCYNAHAQVMEFPVRRSLKVWLHYRDRNVTEHLYTFDSERDNAGKFWNTTSIDIIGKYNDSFKVIFEAYVEKSGNPDLPDMCRNIATIALNDISLHNYECSDDREEAEVIDEEQTLGINLVAQASRGGQEASVTACGPLWQHNCGFARESNGVCYEFTDNSADMKLVKIHNPVQKECIRGKIDVIMLVDQSGSVNECNFEKIKKWLRSIVHGFTIGPTEQDISIVIYSSIQKTYYLEELGFENYGNNGDKKKEHIIKKLRQVKFQGGGTYTGEAFKFANNMLMGGKARPDARKMVILLTDGSTTMRDREKLRKQVVKSKQTNTTIIAIGVAKFNATELKIISSGKNFFPVKKFSELSKIQDKLRSSVSHGLLEGSSTGHTNSSDETVDLQHCQLGMSTHYATESLLMGSPGCFRSVGDVITYTKQNATAADNQKLSLANATTISNFTGQIRKNDLSTSIEYSIPSIDIIEKAFHGHVRDIYLGYSVTSGFFRGVEVGELFATSAPRFNNNGSVVIYKSNHTTVVSEHQLLNGRQYGEYYGACMTAVDINGDGFTELLVGAPLHTAENPDEGRVYVYLGAKSVSSDPSSVLKGSGAPFGRFGSTIVAIGDLTLDGYEDVAIASPYEDSGVVYIFHGGPSGVHSEYVQRITPSAIHEKFEHVRLFGQSIVGNIDFDNNSYPDILIGVPGSDLIAIMYSRTVVKLHSSLTVLSSLVDRRSDNCKLQTADSEPCVKIQICFYYTGAGVPSNISVAYNVTVDGHRDYPRFYFHSIDKSFHTYNFTIFNSNNWTCTNKSLYMRANVRDFLLPSIVKLEFTMLERVYNLTSQNIVLRKHNASEEKHVSNSHLHPVLDKHIPLNKIANINFLTDCGVYGTCASDVSISGGLSVDEAGNTNKGIEISSKRIIRVYYNISNRGPYDGNDIRVKITYPKLLVFSVLENMNKNCFEINNEVNERDKYPYHFVLQLLYRNSILKTNESCQFIVVFIASELVQPWTAKFLNFNATVTHLNNDLDLSNNKIVTNIPVKYKTGFQTVGLIEPLAVNAVYNKSTLEVIQNSSFLHFKQTLVTRNIGFVKLKDVRIKIDIPTTIVHQNHVLNIFEIQNINASSNTGNCNWKEPYHELPTLPGNVNVSLDETKCGEDNSLCSSISCKTPILNIGEQTRVTVQLKAIASSLIKLEKPATFLSHGRVYVKNYSSLEMMVKSQESVEFTIEAYRIPYQTFKQEDSSIFVLPFWVYIASAALGLILLLLIILILKRLKFFESKYAEKKQAAEEERLWAEENSPLDPQN